MIQRTTKPQRLALALTVLTALGLAGLTTHSALAQRGRRPAAPSRGESSLSQLPVVRERLSNGLRVVLSPDRSIPTVGIALYYDVGSRNEQRGITAPHHNPRFDIDESCLPQGVAISDDRGATWRLGFRRPDFYISTVDVAPGHPERSVLWLKLDGCFEQLPGCSDAARPSATSVVSGCPACRISLAQAGTVNACEASLNTTKRA